MIHVQYAKLQEAAIEFPNGFAQSAIKAIDTIMASDAAFAIVKENGLILAGDDRAERVVEAFAVALVSGNIGLQAELTLADQREKQREQDCDDRTY